MFFGVKRGFQYWLSPEAYISGERPSSGIAGWRGGWIEGNGSEGTRPALLPAGPVPERLITVAVARKSPRPAISWTSPFGHIVFMLAIIHLGFSFFFNCRFLNKYQKSRSPADANSPYGKNEYHDGGIYFPTLVPKDPPSTLKYHRK